MEPLGLWMRLTKIPVYFFIHVTGNTFIFFPFFRTVRTVTDEKRPRLSRPTQRVRVVTRVKVPSVYCTYGARRLWEEKCRALARIFFRGGLKDSWIPWATVGMRIRTESSCGDNYSILPVLEPSKFPFSRKESKYAQSFFAERLGVFMLTLYFWRGEYFCI
jgi:hypothetical protein